MPGAVDVTAQAATFGLGAFISVLLLGMLAAVLKVYMDFVKSVTEQMLAVLKEQTASNVALTGAVNQWAALMQKNIEMLGANLARDIADSSRRRRASDSRD